MVKSVSEINAAAVQKALHSAMTSYSELDWNHDKFTSCCQELVSMYDVPMGCESLRTGCHRQLARSKSATSEFPVYLWFYDTSMTLTTSKFVHFKVTQFAGVSPVIWMKASLALIVDLVVCNTTRWEPRVELIRANVLQRFAAWCGGATGSWTQLTDLCITCLHMPNRCASLHSKLRMSVCKVDLGIDTAIICNQRTNCDALSPSVISSRTNLPGVKIQLGACRGEPCLMFSGVFSFVSSWYLSQKKNMRKQPSDHFLFLHKCSKCLKLTKQIRSSSLPLDCLEANKGWILSSKVLPVTNYAQHPLLKASKKPRTQHLRCRPTWSSRLDQPWDILRFDSWWLGISSGHNQIVLHFRFYPFDTSCALSDFPAASFAQPLCTTPLWQGALSCLRGQ